MRTAYSVLNMRIVARKLFSAELHASGSERIELYRSSTSAVHTWCGCSLKLASIILTYVVIMTFTNCKHGNWSQWRARCENMSTCKCSI